MIQPAEPDLVVLLRRSLLALAGLGSITVAIELSLIEHWHGPWQLPALAALILVAAMVIMVGFRPTNQRIRLTRWAGLAVITVGLIGSYQHIAKNRMFAAELYPDRSWLSLWWAGASGRLPALAPLVLAQLAGLILLSTVRHPMLVGGHGQFESDKRGQGLIDLRGAWPIVRSVIGEQRSTFLAAVGVAAGVAGLLLLEPWPLKWVIDQVVSGDSLAVGTTGKEQLQLGLIAAVAVTVPSLASFGRKRLASQVSSMSDRTALLNQAWVFDSLRRSELAANPTLSPVDQLVPRMADVNTARELVLPSLFDITLRCSTLIGGATVFTLVDWRLFSLVAIPLLLTLVSGRPGPRPLPGLVLGVVLVMGALRSRSGLISPGELLLALAYTRLIWESIGQLPSDAARLTNGIGASIRLAKLGEEPIDTQSPGRPAPRIQGELTFEDVSHASEEGQASLSDFNWRIPRGSLVAVTGSDTATASILLSLILRTQAPAGGRVLVDGLDISTLRFDTYRSQITYVTREPTLFYGTLRANILYGRPDATESDLYDAASCVALNRVIDELPDRYETVLDGRSDLLSAGQVRLVMLARAALRHAPLIVIDEPFAGLDAHEQAQVASAIVGLAAGHTTLVTDRGSITKLDPDLELRLDLNQTGTGRSPDKETT